MKKSTIILTLVILLALSLLLTVARPTQANVNKQTGNPVTYSVYLPLIRNDPQLVI